MTTLQLVVYLFGSIVAYAIIRVSSGRATNGYSVLINLAVASMSWIIVAVAALLLLVRGAIVLAEKIHSFLLGAKPPRWL